MKKFLLTIALVLLCGATMAQEERDGRLTAKELNEKTEKTAILIRCTQKDSRNTYFNQNGQRAALTVNSVVYWVPAGDGAFYITRGEGDGDYLQNNNISTFGSVENAAKFHAVKPTSTGSSVSYTDGGNIYTTEAEGGEYWVRFAFTDDSKWFNFNGFTYNTGTGVWTVQNVYDATEHIVEPWKSKALQTCGYVGGYAADLADEIEAIETYEQLVEFEKANNARIEISTDEFYRIVAVSPKAANGDTNHKVLAFNGEGNLVTTLVDDYNVNQIFKFEDAGEGNFYLKNLNADGYLNKIAAGTYRSAIVTKTDACKLDLTHYGDAQWKLHNSESDKGTHCLFAENHATEAVPYACSGWENGANSASAWYIIPAKYIKVTVNKYASVYLPFAVKVEGATAYAVTATSETSATLTEMADIAANEGAILAGNDDATLNIINAATEDWSANKLEGTTYTTNVAKDAYVLFNGENGIGFYKADKNQAEGTAFKNWANKAYLPTTEGMNAVSYSFRFGEGTTGVEEVKTENGEVKTVYDLTGRRVEAITAPGIYIVGGKKVLVK